ncbi:MAG: ABC transporter permease [Patescibacteria group bacterium]|nr:ABC transporter permease [Patescibacteria group bacterium]
MSESLYYIKQMSASRKKIPRIKIVDLVSLSLRNFKVKTGRTFLTVLGIGVSFATIFFLISLGYGLQNILLKEISSEEALLTLDVYSPNQTAMPLDNKFVEAMRATGKVSKIDPIIAVQGQMDVSNTAFEVLIQGVSQDFFKSSNQKIKKGGAPKEDGGEVLITSELEELLNGGRAARNTGKEIIGANLKLTYYVPDQTDGVESVKIVEAAEPFKISGVLENGGGNYVYLPFSKISNLNLPYYRVKVLAKDGKALEEIKNKIVELGFNASSVADTVDQANKIFNILKIILAFFGISALIVSIVGMINTMTIALLERTNEIGVMKVFGIAEGDVQKLFMLESTIIGFLGGVSGLIMGYAFSQIFNLSILFLAQALGGKAVNLFYYPPWFIIAIIVFASLVGLITGYFPSRRAARLDPLIALRYK